ncbi:oligoendopeptidase F [Anaerosporobacter faecicola]|uniref:oligoendopeptidase F n=1 Tax=Anaerosporobacter faecicola TaxID=2718714 RepID=UPI001A9A9443|nr:oligoendopeptidase F [Anaerosporobacter faecicola]
MSKTNKIVTRDEIMQKDKWAIEDLFQNDEDWKKEFEQVKSLCKDLQAYEGKLGESASTLYEYLKLKSEAEFHFERVYVYANEKYHENTANGTYQNLADQANGLEVLLNSAVAFDMPEILAIPDEKIEQFLSENKELQPFTRVIKEITRKKAHTLTAQQEAILADAGEVLGAPSNIFSMFNNADLKFPSITGEDGEKVPVTHGRYITYMESKDRRVRKEAFESVYHTYQGMKNTSAAMFSANVKASMFRAKAKKYENTLEMYLDDTDVPVSVYTNLIETVHSNLPKFYKYVALRKKLLGVEELHMYDVYAPLVSDVEMSYTFDEAKEIVLEGLVPLGERYINLLKEGFANRWIDIYENEGKRSGAYSWGAYGTHPYVLLNYHENLDNVFTLAHEMGHALHSYHSNETQPFQDAGYKIFVAEVASTCNEALLIQHLLNKIEDKKQRAYLVNYFIESFKGTLFRQTMFAEFEMRAHAKAEAGEALTSEELCKLYHELNQTYFGKDMIVDEEIDMEWARIPHFYTPFYVYQYATGFSAAIALSRRILKEGSKAVEDYVGFLRGGCSKDPISLLRGAGVDMASKDPINEALLLFGELVDELEELTK